ncbi:MAG TPA: DNA topoisomerase VI, partial [Methanoculleus sp.]|nr:DNA topoisomerase VI [Methanoculleus sp.]
MSRKTTDALAEKQLVGIARFWYDQMRGGDLPSISMPTRTKQNIAYD